MQLLNFPSGSDHVIWPIVQPGHNTGRAPARAKNRRGRVTMTWPRLAHSRRVRDDRKDTFISTLAHELRQPLSVLRTTVDLVRLGPDRAAADITAEVMARQIARMNRLIDDLIEETRWALGKLPLRRERLDVRALVIDAVSDVRAVAAEQGHALGVIDASEALWVNGDSHRLHQVISNLLRNAVKFSGAGGHISIAVAREGASVTICVADTGCGIAPDALPHIFDLFSQVRPTDTEGLGIGLSIVKEIVALHGGRIEARSHGLGQGSEFIVTLPLA